MKKILLILVIFFSLVWGQPAKAAGALANVDLAIMPLTAGSTATWTISFTIPETTKLGHLMVSLGGYQPNLSSTELSVSGLPAGTAIVGKSNPNCVFNCDDVRYYYNDPISVNKNAKVVLTLKNVKNPAKEDNTGLTFINLYSSKYPQTVLAFSAGEKLLTLTAANPAPAAEELIPPTATNEAPANTGASGIGDVILNELFYKPGAKTTKLNLLKDPAKVDNLTLDLLGKEKVVFKGSLDLSKPEAVKFFSNLSEYLDFQELKLTVKQELLDYFKVPLEVTYYNLPFVWDADVQKDKGEALTKDKLENYQFVIYDNQPQITFTLKEGGSYQLVPHFELFLKDNQQIDSKDGSAIISGRISDPQAQVKISLNNKELNNLVVAIDPKTGEFSAPVNLQEGANLIIAKATSKLGEIADISKIVQYQSEFKPVEQKKSSFSLINMAAILLTILAIILIFIIRNFVKKRR